MTAPAVTALAVEDVHAWYGSAHVLHGVDLAVAGAPLAVVGRNGMGKTTLCQAVTGLLGPDHRGRATGAVRVGDRDVLGEPPHRVARAGVAYVPQGRRVFPSLTVHEHLRIVRHAANWDAGRIYDLFPRLAQRRRHGGGELSGGEQQMLAIGRALLSGPAVLVMDEPSEGLAPAVARHLADTVRELARTEAMTVLAVEQNLGVAAALADTLAVMVSGRVVATLPASELRADTAAQRRWLGVS